MKRAIFAMAILAGAAAGEAVEVTPGAAGVSASTSDANVAANAVDNNLSTRWSGNGVGAWIQFDLGSVRTVEYVTIAVHQGNTRRNRFDVLLSSNGSTWSTALAGVQSSGQSTQEEMYDFADAPARYVRYVGQGATINATGASSTWNSLAEVSVFAAATSATPTPTATPEGPGDAVEVTPGASGATASANDGNVPANAVDDNVATRWSANGEGQWIRLDLGHTFTLSHVVIAFYNGNQRQSRFDIQASSDGAAWTTVLAAATSNGTSTQPQTFDVPDVAARYVRYLGHGNSVNLWNSLTEISVFARPCTACPSPTPTPRVTARPTATPTPTPTSGPTPTPGGGTRPVDINGQLSVCGTKLCNQHGNPIQLRGMSTHGLQWYPGCIDSNAPMDALVNDWKADVLRVSMYVQEGGYETNPAAFTELADRIIDRAVARGIYVVIDWHMLSPGDPMVNLDSARTYFTHMTQRYGHLPNVIYEIANEPSGVSWARIRDYANQIIPTIRNIDPNGVVLVGTRAWSSLGVSEGSGPTEIFNNPVNHPNVMYVFHMYAASHGTEYINALSTAADQIPMFVTEWGTQTASGDGTNNFTRSQQYVDLMRTKKISWINWNWSDDMRSGAVFTGGTCPGGPYTGSGGRLKPAGTWIRERILSPADDFPTN